MNCASQQHKSNWIKPELEGQWELVSTTTAENTPFLNNYSNHHIVPGEALPPEPAPYLIFENDTMYDVDWPLQIINRTRFTLDSGYLTNHFKRLSRSRPIGFEKDTLFIYTPFYAKKYIKEAYVKTDLDDSIVDILKRDEVNYPELAGTWFLIREESLGGEDGSEWNYLLEFPHSIPDSIQISREQFISGLEQKKVYLMTTDGEERKYFFSYNWYLDYLYLTPGEWYQGEAAGIHFKRNQTGN